MTDARDIALTILMDIENGTYSNIALERGLRKNQFSEKKDRAFITRLVEGTVERRITLDYILDLFSKTRMKKCKPLIRTVLRMGAYQIMYMYSVPDSAACNESVRLVKRHGFSNLSGFVNGVLRNVARNRDKIEYPSRDNQAKYCSIKYSVPEWLCEKLISDYPEKAESVLETMFVERDTTIRVNDNLISRHELVQLLEDKGIKVSYGLYDEKALHISGYDFVRKLPGYKKGYFAVQDESSMCAIRAAGIKQNDVVIDMCAAPGGKSSAAMLYMDGRGRLFSRDISNEKIPLIEENITAMGFKLSKPEDMTLLDEYSDLRVNVCCRDALDIQTFLVGRADVVIADVPCSGLGIAGRKNDIKYRLKADQISELVTLQRDIMDVAKQYVKKGGTLLYSTCTINPDENENNVKLFLNNNSDFELSSSRLFLPGTDKCDGFYYAVIKRK